MGAQDRHFGLDHEATWTGDHPVRLRFSYSLDGSSGGPAHYWADVHGTNDVPVTQADLDVMRFAAQIAGKIQDRDAVLNAVRALMIEAWGEATFGAIMTAWTGNNIESETARDAAGTALLAILRARYALGAE